MDEPVTEEGVLNILEEAIGLAENSTLKEYILTALIKLTIRIPNSLPRIRDIITSQSSAISVEIQQRACEYLCILESSWDRYRKGVLETMPALKREEGDAVEIGVIPVDANPKAVAPAVSAAAAPAAEAVGNLLDFDLVMDTPVVEAPAGSAPAVPISTQQALMDIFIPTSEPAVTSAAPVMNLFDTAPPQDLEFEEFTSATPSSLDFVAYADAQIRVDFSCTKPDLDNPQITSIDVKIVNPAGGHLTAVNVQAAVPKHLKLALTHPSGTELVGTGLITQNMKVTNSM